MTIKDQANSLSYVSLQREPTETNFNYEASGLLDINDLKGVLYGTKWNATTLYYCFPTIVDDYGPSYEAPEELVNLRPVSEEQKNVIKYGLNEVSEYTLLNFTEVANSSSKSPQLRFAVSDYPLSAYSYYPDPSNAGGDAFYGPYIDPSPNKGSYSWHTIIHELGHQLGLKHGHEESSVYAESGLALSTLHDSQDYSIMTYHTHLGDTDLYFKIADGEAPISFMMSDILGLQYLYGANYNTRSGDTTYKWSPNNNNTTISENGIVTIKSGGYQSNKIITTIWDGNGIDTYDFSNYSVGTKINLNPGNYSIGSLSQLADLNELLSGNEAIGNIYNAYLLNGNRQSLIENAVGGSGNDNIIGNIANNNLFGNFGDDTLFGLSGNDSLQGGRGNDLLIGGLGSDNSDGGEGSDIYIIENLEDYASTELINDTGLEGVDEIRIVANTPGTIRLKASTLGIEKIVIGTGTASTPVLTSLVAVNINSLAVSYGLQIQGNDGDNIINGTAYNDIISGGSGKDTIIGGKGLDLLTGGLGDDLFQISGFANVDDLGNGADILQVAAGGVANFSLVADWRGTTATYNNGVVNITTNGYDVNLSEVSGGKNGFNITSHGAAVEIVGSKFSDVITGGAANDFIFGGVGKDVMNGNAGRDIFIYKAISDSLVGSNSDVIIGFSRGYDKIDLSLIDAKQQTTALGDQAFSFSKSASANSIWWLKSGVDTIIYGDVNGAVNGSVTADFSIKLQGISPNQLSFSDFIA